MTDRENYLRMVRFERPDYIPMSYCINGACWNAYPQEQLLDLMEAHPFLFPDFKRPELPFHPQIHPVARKDRPFRDDWGCIWETTCDGITGTVTGHPLEDWERFSDYLPPDPEKVMGIGPIDWEKEAETIAQARKRGELVFRGLRHEHTFLQLCDIRGYENLLFDMEDEEPCLDKLIDMVEQFNLALIRHYCSLGVDIINLQDLVNGIDWIRNHLAGKCCIELDIDRQSVTVNGTPADIDRFIRSEVEALGSRQGGLCMIYGLYPGTPIENAAAVMDAMEKYAFYFS